MPNKTVHELKARSVRSSEDPGSENELGLWVDYNILRKHQGRPAQTIILDPNPATNNRYLELADLALRTNKPKKKAKITAGD